MNTETKLIKPSKDNVILGLARRDNPYSFNANGNLPFEKGYIVGFNKCEKIHRKQIDNYDSLLDIAKRCEFIFGNEANYPEGTIGYRLCQDAKKVINNL